jgi:hypothetical protein
MLKKIFLILTAALFIPFTAAQDLDYGEGKFTANFDIDSAHTTDGTNYKISATGEAGPYGRVWLSYEFTDKLGLGDSGEFTGFAWTQNGEQFATATLQGVYRREGSIFKMYSLDMVSDGVINIVSGEADFVDKTMTFKASQLK